MATDFLTRITLPRHGWHKKERAQVDPFFEVIDHPIKTGDYDFGDRYLVNSITGDKVGMISGRYKVTTHRQASDLVKGILAKAGLEFTAQPARTSNKGARFFENIMFPSLIFNPAENAPSTALDNKGLKKDDHIPRITIINSYDKSYPVLFIYGMLRCWCDNGATLPIKVTKLSFWHLKEVDAERVKNELVSSLEDSKKLMQYAYDKLNGEKGAEYLCKILTGGFSDKFQKLLLDKLNASDSTLKVDFDEETDPNTKITVMKIKSITTEATAYAVYNAVTDVATHAISDRNMQEKANAKIAKLFITA